MWEFFFWSLNILNVCYLLVLHLVGTWEGGWALYKVPQKLVYKKSLYFFACCMYRPVVWAMLTINFWLLLSPNDLFHFILFYLFFPPHSCAWVLLFFVNLAFNEEMGRGIKFVKKKNHEKFKAQFFLITYINCTYDNEKIPI